MARSLDAARRWFAEDLRVAAPILRNELVVEAFAQVRRELFCGSGPWRVHPRRRLGMPYTTPSADPSALYHDLLVVIDEERDLNNGQPSLWAYIFDQLDLSAGQSVLQIGAGTGYYTAILAEVVGVRGRVDAVELDTALCKRAQETLVNWPQAAVTQGNGVDCDPKPAADAIIAFAGATHPPSAWIERLSPGGKMMVPLTTADGWGFLLKIEKTAKGFEAASLGPCGFFHCEGARRPDEEIRLQEALTALNGKEIPVRALHPGKAPTEAKEVWFAGDSYWLSSAPLVNA
ncbi:protein-L-isoaspartate O-methyltransferase family protein [Pelagibius sp.]|uniref:protein-L-isoaspartate O-methyltransferase family protein n=1 Tax=Pelagibius sp. TaxID=1931238 RepID=UPI003BB06D8F